MMIDGIPNRPLYVYQKDIIVVDANLCEVLGCGSCESLRTTEMVWKWFKRFAKSFPYI